MDKNVAAYNYNGDVAARRTKGGWHAGSGARQGPVPFWVLLIERDPVSVP